MKKTAIISGAAGNMGLALVKKMIAEDFQVEAAIAPFDPVDFYRDDHLHIQQLDLTNEKEVQNFVGQVTERRREIDVAVLTVGGFAMGSLAETGQAELKKMYTLNFETAYFLARAVFLQMEKQSKGGSIILVGARPALDANIGKDMVSYALSKKLIFHLSELLNAEGKKKNITSTVIVPSIIDTPPNRKAMPDANFLEWVTPEQIAGVVAFICSEVGKVLRESVIKIYNKA